MSRLIDLTGQRFGMLTVLRRAESRNGKVCWTCRCDCGSTIEVSGNNLKRGHTVSCGCKRVFPYIGKRFGMLTVLEKTAETVRHGRNPFSFPLRIDPFVAAVKAPQLPLHSAHA